MKAATSRPFFVASQHCDKNLSTKRADVDNFPKTETIKCAEMRTFVA